MRQYGEKLLFGGLLASAAFMVSGVLCGSFYGWHATAISRITLSGLCFIPGYFGGFALIDRAKEYKELEKTKIDAATSHLLNDPTGL